MLHVIGVNPNSTQVRHGSSLIGVVISDFYVPDVSATIQAANVAKTEEGIEMFSISVGSYQASLRYHIASEPKADHIMSVSSSEDLDTLVNMLVKVFCIPSR